MNNYAGGKVEFYQPHQIEDIEAFLGKPTRVRNSERRFRLVIDGKTWFVVLTGHFAYLNGLELNSIYKKFVLAQKLKEQIMIVSREFHVTDDVTISGIAKTTGINHHVVNKILEHYLLDKDEIAP